MPRDSQGLYTLPLPPVLPGELVESNWANTTLDDLSAALTGSLPRDGSAPMTGPLTLSADPINAARQATTKAYVDQFMAYATGLPIGAVIPMANLTTLPGFLVCDGVAYSRTTFSDLFALIGTIYGAGDGATTFNVPDLRNWFIRGRPDGRAVGSQEAAAFASHTHAVSDPGHIHGASQAVHGHTIATGSHSHGVNDPGHEHPYGFEITGGFGVAAAAAGTPWIHPTGGVGTGISIQPAGNLGGSTDAQQPAVTVNPNGSNVSVGVAGGTETRPQNVAMIYVIKAVNDSPGSGVITGITSSDVNMIDIDNTNPLVPELDIQSNVAFGTVKLDAGGKVPLAQMPTSGTQFLGYFDASPGLLPVGVFLSGDYYSISVGGTLTVYDPVTLTASSTLVAAGSQLHYVSGSLTNPTGWYYVTVSGATLASDVQFIPTGTIDATNVQTAIEELDSEKMQGNGPAFAAKATVNQAMTSGSTVKVNLDGEVIDTANCFSASRFTPNVAGYYHVDALVKLDGTSVTLCLAQLYKNGIKVIRGLDIRATGVTSLTSSLSYLIYMNGTTDYLELFVGGSGTAPVIDGTSDSTYFSGSLARAV